MTGRRNISPEDLDPGIGHHTLPAGDGPPTPNRDHRRRTAIHEAGHAVADVVCGHPLEYVSIRPGRTFRGISVPTTRDRPDAGAFDPWRTVAQQPPAFRADIERQILAFLAGDIAALYLGPRHESGYRDESAADEIARQALADLGPRLAELVVGYEESDDPDEGDEVKARGLASAFAGEAGALYLEWLRIEARGLVLGYRAAILRVADALERHAVLRGDQVAALVNPPKQGVVHQFERSRG